ncbi:hypothetical protein EMPS_11384 [Entomortierella parvispora]|uniref:GH16 domain-containing protein n=1 Tax=Entomortierella parvispora TaxID=205924 RepID=A0A9P3HLZ9_9FUNG|nr:hypothetical protein EMPS_11384 [Entomortierella parvispora]
MKTSPFSSKLLSICAATAILFQQLPATVEARKGFHESLTSLDNFVIAHAWGPARWGSAYNKSRVATTPYGTEISISDDSLLKPFSCGEIIHREEHLGYGYYSLDIIASPVVGQVTGFFLIAAKDPAQSELDVELTGLNNGLAWMTVWYNHNSKPTSIAVPFDTSKDWHNYMMEWRRDYIAWYIDGKVVLNRTDIEVTPPNKVNYRLAINSWAQVREETNLAWAGTFKLPEAGTAGLSQAPVSKFRNLKYRPASPSQFHRKSATSQGHGASQGAISDALDMSSIAFEDDGDDIENDGTSLSTSSRIKHNKNAGGPKRLQSSYVVGVEGVEGSLVVMAASISSPRSFSESLTDNLDNFDIAEGMGGQNWGSSYSRKEVHITSKGTQITIGQDSPYKPFSSGKITYKNPVGYGTYSVDMIGSSVVGQVVGFFLIAHRPNDPHGSEIDIELTGLNTSLAWMNVWYDNKQYPVSVPLKFDNSKDWHNYKIEWQKDFIAYSIDGAEVLRKTDVKTTDPAKANYQLALNTWTQIVPETNLAWAGKFVYPKNGEVPMAQFKNLKYEAS